MHDIVHNERTAFDVHGSTQDKLAYDNWIKSLTNNGTAYPKLNPNGTSQSEIDQWNDFKTKYDSFLSAFNVTPNNPYTSDILSMNPKALINLFNQINPNCQ